MFANWELFHQHCANLAETALSQNAKELQVMPGHEHGFQKSKSGFVERIYQHVYDNKLAFKMILVITLGIPMGLFPSLALSRRLEAQNTEKRILKINKILRIMIE